MNFEDKRTLVVISDRDESFKEILALRLEQDKAMRCMSVGIRPEEILHAVREYRPKVLILPFYLENETATLTIQSIMSSDNSTTPYAAIAVTDSCYNEYTNEEVTKAGAAGYIIKTYSLQTLAERIKQIAICQEDILVIQTHMLKTLSDMFIRLGIPENIKGCKYLKQAIVMSARDSTLTRKMTSKLYPAIARINKTTPQNAERAMRHAISTAWDRGELEALEELFGYTVHCERGKPTNSEFIAMMAKTLCEEYARVQGIRAENTVWRRRYFQAW